MRQLTELEILRAENELLRNQPPRFVPMPYPETDWGPTLFLCLVTAAITWWVTK